jgi:replication factor C subunit 1
MKSSQVVAPKKGASKEKPDLEEALDESEDEAPADDADVKEEDDLEGDLSKDKYVKAPKKKKAPAAAMTELRSVRGNWPRDAVVVAFRKSLPEG